MTPHRDALTELHLLVDSLEAQANMLRAMPARRESDDTRWEDQRTEAIAAVWETLDRIEPALGARFMAAQFKDGDVRYAEWLFKHHAVKLALDGAAAPANVPPAPHLPQPELYDGSSALQR